MNRCCMDNTQQKVMRKNICFSLNMLLLYKCRDEVKNRENLLSFLSNRWSYGVVLYEISTIGKYLFLT